MKYVILFIPTAQDELSGYQGKIWGQVMWVSGWDWRDQGDGNNWSAQVGVGPGTQELLFQ